MNLEDRASPKISVVVTARNDNHGGNLLKRMQIFVDAFIEQAKRHGLDCELIVVEWNPPPDKPRLAQALAWPRETGLCSVRIIEVPGGVHQRYRFSDKLPLFQMIAKNVGVRRARGQYVLCTNIDLLFSDELVRFLASERLDPRRMYRVDRLDVPAAIPQCVPVSQQLEYCRQNVIRINTRWGTFKARGRTSWSLMTTLWPSFAAGAGRLREALRSKSAHEIVMRSFAAGAGRVREALRSKSAHEIVMRLLEISWSRGRVALAWLVRLPKKVLRLAINQRRRGWFKPLHTNACGDFTLLARERWHGLRGYPEVEMFSFHLDSILCHMAVLSGAREMVLGRRLCAYHIEHASGWSPEDGERLSSRIRAMGVPMLDLPAYYAWIDRMKPDRRRLVANDETWGLVLEDLDEVDPVAPNVGPARVESLEATRGRA